MKSKTVFGTFILFLEMDLTKKEIDTMLGETDVEIEHRFIESFEPVSHNRINDEPSGTVEVLVKLLVSDDLTVVDYDDLHAECNSNFKHKLISESRLIEVADKP